VSISLRFRAVSRIAACLIALSLLLASSTRADQYKNFRVAIYIPVFVVKQMQDPKWLQTSWDTISHQRKVDKVYIETYRSHQIAD